MPARCPDARTALIGIVSLLLFTPSPSAAEVTLHHPLLPTLAPTYAAERPSWGDFAPAATMVSALTSPLDDSVQGDVISRVYFVNGSDGAAGLAFSYVFHYSGTQALTTARLPLNGWTQAGITGAGATNDGQSTPVSSAQVPLPGFTSWADGSPYALETSLLAGPEIAWTGWLGGTELRSGDASATVWFTTGDHPLTSGQLEATAGEELLNVVVLVPAHLPEPGSALLFLAGAGWISRRSRRRP